jgi:hypothetical protein
MPAEESFLGGMMAAHKAASAAHKGETGIAEGTTMTIPDQSTYMILFHAKFLMLGCLMLYMITPDIQDQAISMGVMYYNVSLWHQTTKRPNHEHLYAMWRTAFAISVFTFFPDWFLVTRLETLTFPFDPMHLKDDAPSRAVPLFMHGLWTCPLMLAIYNNTFVGVIGRSKRRMQDGSKIDDSWYDKKDSFAGACNTGAMVLFLAEALFTHDKYSLAVVWQPTAAVTKRIGHVAMYVLPAEFLLGGLAWLLHKYTKDRHGVEGWIWRGVGGVVVAGIYCGLLIGAWYVCEVLM